MATDLSWLTPLINEVLIPEIGIVFRAHANAGLPPPTSAQVIAALAADVTKYEQVGQAFLAATKPGA